MTNLESILIVDDDASLTKVLSGELQSVGYDVQIATNGKEALEKSEKGFFELILLDWKMPGMDGLEVLKELQKKSYPGKIILMTGYADLNVAMDARRLGASDFLSKPYDIDELLITIRKVLHSE